MEWSLVSVMGVEAFGTGMLQKCNYEVGFQTNYKNMEGVWNSN